MPVINGVMTTYDVNTNAKDVSGAFYAIKKEETPLFNQIELSGPAEATSHEWWDDQRQIRGTTLGGAYTAASGTMTVAAFAGIRKGMVLALANIIFRVTATPTTAAVAVTRIGGAADGNQASGLKVDFLGTASSEGKDYEDSDYTTEVKRTNVCQIFDDYVKITGTQGAVRREINDGKMLDQAVLKKLERQFLFAGRAIWRNPLVSPNDNLTPRIMGGVDYFMTTYGYAPAAATFSAANIDAWVLELEQRGASPMELWMSPYDMGRFGDLDSSKIQLDRSDTMRGVKVTDYMTKYGHELKIHTDPQAPVGKIYCFRKEQVKLLPLKGRQFTYTPLAKTGDSEKGQIVGEYTLEFWNAATSGIFTPS